MKIKLVKTKNPQRVPKTLREKSERVDDITPEILDLIEKMKKIMNENRGLGISAIQVGCPLRIMIIKIGEEDLAFINPIIIERSKNQVPFREGCLSFPTYYVNIVRPEEVVMNAKTADGKKIQIKANGLPGRAIQHELDHMNGKVFVDYAKSPSEIEKAEPKSKTQTTNSK